MPQACCAARTCAAAAMRAHCLYKCSIASSEGRREGSLRWTRCCSVLWSRQPSSSAQAPSKDTWNAMGEAGGGSEAGMQHLVAAYVYQEAKVWLQAGEATSPFPALPTRTGRWRLARGVSLPPWWCSLTVSSTRCRMNCTPCALHKDRPAIAAMQCDEQVRKAGARMRLA